MAMVRRNIDFRSQEIETTWAPAHLVFIRCSLALFIKSQSQPKLHTFTISTESREMEWTMLLFGHISDTALGGPRTVLCTFQTVDTCRNRPAKRGSRLEQHIMAFCAHPILGNMVWPHVNETWLQQPPVKCMVLSKEVSRQSRGTPLNVGTAVLRKAT